MKDVDLLRIKSAYRWISTTVLPLTTRVPKIACRKLVRRGETNARSGQSARGRFPKAADAHRRAARRRARSRAGFPPLDGFMTHADWEGVCDRYCTASGLFWPIPITLSVSEETAGSIQTG